MDKLNLVKRKKKGISSSVVNVYILSPTKKGKVGVELSTNHKSLAFTGSGLNSSPTMSRPMFSLTDDSSLLSGPR